MSNHPSERQLRVCIEPRSVKSNLRKIEPLERVQFISFSSGRIFERSKFRPKAGKSANIHKHLIFRRLRMKSAMARDVIKR